MTTPAGWTKVRQQRPFAFELRSCEYAAGAHQRSDRTAEAVVAGSVETATKRIRSRLALGERGPHEKAILQIDAELNRASDIDIVLTNDSSMEDFYRQIDGVLEPLVKGLNGRWERQDGPGH